MPNLKTHIKETLKLSLPVSIGQLGHIMMGVVDTIMVGKLGSVYLAASAVSNGIFFLILVLGFGMSMAITPLVSIAIGANRSDDCGVILRQGLIVNLVFGFLLTATIFFGSDLIKFMGQDPDVAVAATSYLKILSLSVLPFIIFQVYRQFVEGLSDVYPPMTIAIIANFFNALFNYVLIFGEFGFKPMGLDGAGFATTTTRTLMGLTLLLFVVKSRRYKNYDTSLLMKKLDLTIIKKVISIGLPSGIQYFFEVGAFVFAAIMVGWLGHIQLASHQIAINLASVTYMMVLGISSAGTIRVGNAVGRKDVKATRRSGMVALGLGGTIMFIAGIVFIIFRYQLPLIYTSEKEVIELTAQLLFIAAAFQVFDGLQATGLGILRGLTDVKVPMIYLLISYWILGLPIGVLLAFYFDMGTIGIWIGLLLGLGILSVLLLIRFNRMSKKMVEF